MARASYSASAPGSLMLLGEHAVLHGRRALVCAVDRRMSVTLTPRADGAVHLASALGRYQSPLAKLAPDPRFRFVLEAIRRRRAELPGGFALRIRSGFSHEVGLGSSAAVTVATVAALQRWCGGGRINRAQLFAESLAVVRAVQGLGSGADVAASVYGGVVAYRAQPRQIRPLGVTAPLTVIYSGGKRPTVEVVGRVAAARRLNRALFDGLYDLMDASVGRATAALRRRDWPALGRLLNLNQGLMDALGVNSPTLAAIVFALREAPGIFGAKISGSGLGDCALGLGRARCRWPWPALRVAMSPAGVQ